MKTVLHLLVAALACSLLLSCTAGQPEEFAFKIAVTEDGMVRVAFDDLGFNGSPPESSKLSLSERGKAVSIEVEDGGDGRFGPGDSLSFLGRHLQGEHSWFNPWSDENIYLLRLRDGEFAPASQPDPVSGADGAAESTLTRHLEREDIRVALTEPTEAPRETWYWKRLSHLDREPFALPLPDGPSPVGIRVALAGLSADAAAAEAAVPQHRVELLLNGHVIASEEWNGQVAVEISAGETELANVIAQASGMANQVELRVPQRHLPGQPAPLIDAVLLNWVEIDFRPSDSRDEISFPGSDGENRYLADAGVHAPRWIKALRAPTLRADIEQADYLMIAHASLLEALAPLAEFHRQQGLKVTVVDVEDIYNEFNHGIVSPFAIRDFIRYASEHRAAPAPRYVLLVGDASWDIRGEASRRGLVPTMQVQAHEELAASDNGFVAIGTDEGRPELAIGRIPAADAAELAVVVDKLLAYGQGNPAGAWQQQVALVSDASPEFQAITNDLAADVAGHGLIVNTVYPGAAAGTAHQDQQQLFDALDGGQLLVHFLGHGGRFVWRTGPLDYKGSSDLFSVTDIEQLTNHERLPLVLSMTCSSGPFDHPQAGSIAEALLMLPEGGAVGVLAASWRVPASESFSALLLDELLHPGRSMGEAILRAKQKEPSQELVESYNFLGDPALRLPLPGKDGVQPVSEDGAGGQMPDVQSQAVTTQGKKLPAARFHAAEVGATNIQATNSPVPNSPPVKPNVITWSTASEHNSFGYEIHRGLAEAGPFEAVNGEVIPGGGTTDLPRRYEFVDQSILPETTYWYYIESISLTGERKRITPIYASKPKSPEPERK